jgi:hypothetical protein
MNTESPTDTLPSAAGGLRSEIPNRRREMACGITLLLLLLLLLNTTRTRLRASGTGALVGFCVE